MANKKQKNTRKLKKAHSKQQSKKNIRFPNKNKMFSSAESLKIAMQHHQAGQLNQAEQIYRQILRDNPNHAVASHFLGVIAHQVGNNDVALTLIKNSIVNKPDYFQAFNNLGIVYFALSNYQEAIHCYQKALSFKPEFADANYNLANAYNAIEQHEEAIESFKKTLLFRPKYVDALYNLANTYKSIGKLNEAIPYYHKVISLKSDYAGAYNNLGNIFFDLNQWQDAASNLKQALLLEPENSHIHKNLGSTLLAQKKISEAINCLNRALEICPDYAEAYIELGNAFNEMGNFEQALLNYQEALKINPQLYEVYSNLGAIYERRNNLELAEEFIEKSLTIKANNPEALLAMAKIKRRQKLFEEAIAILEPVLNETHRLQSQAHFELGKLYDLLYKSDDAFSHFLTANELQKEKHITDSESDSEFLKEIKQIANTIEQKGLSCLTHHSVKSESSQLVFLVGFPRSGTTLLDQILDSHPAIQVMEEKTILDSIFFTSTSRQTDYIDSVCGLTEADILRLRRQYFDAVNNTISRDLSTILIDKLPLNIVHIPLIYRLFPDAKIILAMRHPCDVVLSNYMQDFIINKAMVNFLSLQNTARLYNLVFSLWNRFTEELPVIQHVVKYESVVANMKDEVGRLLDFLELDWDDSVANYTNRAKAKLINTPSYQAVTEPIYQHAKYRWKRYESYLLPIMFELEPFIRQYQYQD